MYRKIHVRVNNGFTNQHQSLQKEVRYKMLPEPPPKASIQSICVFAYYKTRIRIYPWKAGGFSWKPRGKIPPLFVNCGIILAMACHCYSIIKIL